MDNEWSNRGSTKSNGQENVLVDQSSLNVAAYNGDFIKVKYCIEVLHIDPLQQNGNGNTALQAAVYGGQLEVFRYLKSFVENKLHSSVAEPNSSISVLHIAALNGHFEIVKFLVEEVGLDPLLSDVKQKTPLHSASQNGGIKVVDYLIDQAKYQDPVEKVVHDTTEMGTTLLHFAVASGNSKLVEHFIVDLHMDPNIQDKFGVAALHVAAREGHLKVIQYLTSLKNCSLLIKTHTYGLNALHIASKNGHLNIVKCLILDKNISANIETNLITKITPLHLAAQSGFLKVVKFLIQTCKCNPLCLTTKRQTPLHFAAMEGNLEVIKYYIEEIKVDPLLKNVNKITPLHLAVRNGKINVVNYYLGTFSQIIMYSPDRLGEQLLFTAVHQGHLEIIKSFVVHQDWTKSAKGFRQTSLLTSAVKRGHLPILKYFTKECGWDCKKSYFLTGGISCGHLSIVRYLFSHTEDKKIFPLHQACYYGHKHIAKYFIEEHGIIPYELDLKGVSPLLCAAYSGQCDIVRFLVEEHNVDIHSGLKGTHNGTQESSLHIACRYKHLDIVMFLCSRQNHVSKILNKNKLSPLHYAVIGGSISVIKFLVFKKCHDLICFDITGKTPMHVAVQYERLNIVKWFFSDLKLNPNIRSNNVLGFTPLHMSCFMGHKKLVQYFITLPTCSINAGNRGNRMTALHIATERNFPSIVKLLCAAENCDILYKSSQGYTALRIAVDHGYFDCTVILVSALKKKGIDYNYPNDSGCTILHSACYQKSLKVITYLLDELKQDFLDIRDKKGRTPLFAAVHQNNIKLVDYLIKRYPESLSAKDVNGNTVLHKAAFEGYESIVKSLILNYSMDPSIQNNFGSTALHLVCANGNKLLVTFLLSFNDRLINIVNKLKRSPLHVVAFEGHLFLAKILVSDKNFKQKNFFSVDINGLTSFELAAHLGFVYFVEYMSSFCLQNQWYQISQYQQSIERFIITAQRSGKILTEALSSHRAAEKRHVSALQYFFTAKLHHPNCRDSLQRTPLHYAAMTFKNERCMQFLLDAGSNLMAEDVFHNHALHYAVALGHIENVRYLLQKYKKNNPTNFKGVLGMNVLDIAIAGGHSTIHCDLMLFNLKQYS